MQLKDISIFMSGATDVTGKKLADELGITGTKAKPTAKKLVIGWGCKTDKSTTFAAGTKTLNHPDAIRSNRNKLTTLDTLRKAGVSVANFVDAKNILAEVAKVNPQVTFPMIGRTKYHQGGKGFWMCPTMGHLQKAIQQEAAYFQTFIDIKDEYRLHVFDGKVIYAVKKVERTNMGAAFTAQHADKIKASAAKAGEKIDEKQLHYTLGLLGKRVLPKPDLVIRSNMRGWKFSSVKVTNVPKALRDTAIASVKAAGLDFGAVDCCMALDGKEYIIEINSGPGLEGTAFKSYIDAFKTKIASYKTVPKAAVQKTATASKTASAAKASPAQAGGAKERLQLKAELLADIIANSDEQEAGALEGVLAKMYSK